MNPLKQVLFNFHDVVLLMTTYLCLLFALLLLTRRENKAQNLLLAAFLACHASIPLHLLISFGEAFNPWISERAPYLFNLFSFAYWLDAPILLWYSRSLLFKDFHFRKYDLLFLIPFVYFIFDLLNFHLHTPAEYYLSSQQDALLNTSLVDRIQTYIRELIRFGIFVLSAIEVYKYRSEIRDTFSNIEKIDFMWLNTIVIGFTLLTFWHLLVLAGIELKLGFQLPVDYESLGLLGNYATLGMISLLIFFSLSHSLVFDGIDRQKLVESAPKSKKPAFTNTEINKLSAFMEQEKPYLNSDLQINQLAKLVDINHRQLSMIMNQHFQKNFFEFVNHYRIEEAKTLLRSEEHKTANVLDIMYEVGFNSKATFNTFFKKQTGQTPSQFRKSD